MKLVFKDFVKKVKTNPLSAVFQFLIISSFIAILIIAFNNKLSPWYRCGVMAVGLTLTIIQLLRLRCPLLIIDRVFASKPKKQLALALFAFIITLDVALCLFPKSGIRYAMADIVGTIKLTHVLEEKDELSKYVVVENQEKYMERWEYARHCLVFFLGLVVFNGLLIATINRVMATRAEQYRKGENTYKGMKNHYLIIGYGASCLPIIRNILKRKDTSPSVHFLILSNQDTDTIRRNIQTQLHDFEERVVIYSGDINARPHLERLNVGKAKEVFVIGEGKEPGRDSLNLECAKTIKEIRANAKKEGSGILQVNVQFDRPTSYSTIKRITFPQSYYKDDRQQETIYLRPFNSYENWARLLWGTQQLDGYKTLDRGQMMEDIPNSEPLLADKHVHLVIAGFSDMGVALLLEALRICHYPNYDEKTGKNKTAVTVIDPKMDALLPRFKSQYPYISQISDFEIEYKTGRVEDENNRELLEKLSLCDDVILTVAICFYDPDYSLSAALCLPDSLYYNLKEGKIIKNTSTQILVRQEIGTGLADLLNKKNGKYSNVKIFGTLDKGIDDTLLDDNMAMFIGAYYHFKYDRSMDFFEEVESDAPKALDEAVRMWIEMNEDEHFSNRYQVEMYKTYKTYRKLLQKRPELLHQMEHLRWCAERSITGYKDAHEQGIKYDKDDFQIHNLIVPCYMLPSSERIKDRDVLEIMDKVIRLSKETKGFKINQIVKE